MAQPEAMTILQTPDLFETESEMSIKRRAEVRLVPNHVENAYRKH